MLPQAGRLSESFVADITVIRFLLRFLLRVYVAMVTLVGSWSPSLVADVALIRFLLSVFMAMTLKTCQLYHLLCMLPQDFPSLWMWLWHLSWVA
jgi:hypothetical protein